MFVGFCRLCDQEIGIHLFEDVRDPYPKGDELPRRKAARAQWMLLVAHHPLEGRLLWETKTRVPATGQEMPSRIPEAFTQLVNLKAVGEIQQGEHLSQGQSDILMGWGLSVGLQRLPAPERIEAAELGGDFDEWGETHAWGAVHIGQGAAAPEHQSHLQLLSLERRQVLAPLILQPVQGSPEQLLLRSLHRRGVRELVVVRLP